MWAVVVLLLGIFFWYYYMMVVRTARTTEEAVGITRKQRSSRKPLLTTALLSALVLGLIGSGTLDLLDTENPHQENNLESYFPVNELLLLLACTTSTFFAWLPLKKENGLEKKPTLDARYVF
jgi:hypothetical protein